MYFRRSLLHRRDSMRIKICRFHSVNGDIKYFLIYYVRAISSNLFRARVHSRALRPPRNVPADRKNADYVVTLIKDSRRGRKGKNARPTRANKQNLRYTRVHDAVCYGYCDSRGWRKSRSARRNCTHDRVCIFAIVEYCTISRNAYATADMLSAGEVFGEDYRRGRGKIDRHS